MHCYHCIYYYNYSCNVNSWDNEAFRTQVFYIYKFVYFVYYKHSFKSRAVPDGTGKIYHFVRRLILVQHRHQVSWRPPWNRSGLRGIAVASAGSWRPPQGRPGGRRRPPQGRHAFAGSLWLPRCHGGHRDVVTISTTPQWPLQVMETWAGVGILGF